MGGFKNRYVIQNHSLLNNRIINQIFYSRILSECGEGSFLKEFISV